MAKFPLRLRLLRKKWKNHLLEVEKSEVVRLGRTMTTLIWSLRLSTLRWPRGSRTITMSITSWMRENWPWNNRATPTPPKPLPLFKRTPTTTAKKFSRHLIFKVFTYVWNVLGLSTFGLAFHFSLWCFCLFTLWRQHLWRVFLRSYRVGLQSPTLG